LQFLRELLTEVSIFLIQHPDSQASTKKSLRKTIRFSEKEFLEAILTNISNYSRELRRKLFNSKNGWNA